MKKIVSILTAMVLLSGTVLAGGAKAEVKIKTSAQCGMCEKNITKAVKGTSGVKKVQMDLKTKVLTVSYDPAKTSPEKLKAAISLIGYDADEVKADAAAYDKLHECCKKPQ